MSANFSKAVFSKIGRLRSLASGVNQYSQAAGQLMEFGESSHGTPQDCVPLTKFNIQTFIDQYDTLLLDCDGVLWRNDHFTAIPGISEAVEKLRAMGKKLLFVTNNAMHGRKAYQRKFRVLAGFEAPTDDIFPVTYSSALYLKNVLGVNGKVYMLGTEGLKDELTTLGITSLGYGPDTDLLSDFPTDLMNQEFDPEVEAVLVAYDILFCYNKLFKAVSYLRNPLCRYVATNDMECGVRLGDHFIQPITGAFVAAVNAASKRQPTVIGKPYLHLFRCLQSVHNIDPSRTIMIGDSLKTDINFAANARIDSLLVLSGVSQLNDFSLPQVKNYPNYYLPSFAHFSQLL